MELHPGNALKCVGSAQHLLTEPSPRLPGQTSHGQTRLDGISWDKSGTTRAKHLQHVTPSPQSSAQPLMCVPHSWGHGAVRTAVPGCRMGFPNLRGTNSIPPCTANGRGQQKPSAGDMSHWEMKVWSQAGRNEIPVETITSQSCPAQNKGSWSG